MDKPNSRDLTTCPDLFEGLEQFIAEQFAHFRRTGAIAIALALPAGMWLAWLANRAA